MVNQVLPVDRNIRLWQKKIDFYSCCIHDRMGSWIILYKNVILLGNMGKNMPQKCHFIPEKWFTVIRRWLKLETSLTQWILVEMDGDIRTLQRHFREQDSISYSLPLLSGLRIEFFNKVATFVAPEKLNNS